MDLLKALKKRKMTQTIKDCNKKAERNMRKKEKDKKSEKENEE